MLMKEIKDLIIEDIYCFHRLEDSKEKMSLLPKLIYRFKTIPFETTARFFSFYININIRKLSLKFI